MVELPQMRPLKSLRLASLNQLSFNILNKNIMLILLYLFIILYLFYIRILLEC